MARRNRKLRYITHHFEHCILFVASVAKQPLKERAKKARRSAIYLFADAFVRNEIEVRTAKSDK